MYSPIGSSALVLLQITVILALVVILVLALRWFKYRERMAMIQRDNSAADVFQGEMTSEERRKRQLARGITTSLVGIAITFGLLTIGVGPWLLVGLIPLFVGLSMILSYLITQPDKPKPLKTTEPQVEVAVTEAPEESNSQVESEPIAEQEVEPESVEEEESDPENTDPFIPTI